MKLVMTLLVRDEADIIDAQIAFHLAAGVDFIVATDHESRDGTIDILERYAAQGVLHLLRESGDVLRQSEWVTRMARIAAADFDADWVINSDADEFWWPSGGDLKDVLSQMPSQCGIVHSFVRPFLPASGDGHFAERMTVRLSPFAPINDPASPFRANLRLLHRGTADIVVGTGNASVSGSSLVPLRGWSPVEVFHFPIRSFAHFERKFLSHYETVRERPRGDHSRAWEAAREGRLYELYERMCVDNERLNRGLADGSLTIDTRLRDALRELAGDPLAAPEFPRRDVRADAEYCVERTVLEAGELVRLRRRADRLDQRLQAIENAAGAGTIRSARGAIRKTRRGTRLVMTLVVRDEADILDAHLAYHLGAGVDFVIATDHRSQDGTTEILESYARAGVLRLIREEHEFTRQSTWQTRMARLAATEHGADWVINSDADEFWWPRGSSLKETLGAVPSRYGVVRALVRNFVPRRTGGGSFSERMTARLAISAPINDPATPFRPVVKVAHRGHPAVVVGEGGSHRVFGLPWGVLDAWYPLEILHFPLRSKKQCARKYRKTWTGWEQNIRGDLARARQASEEGRRNAVWDRVAVDDAEVERGLAKGWLVSDARLRDALRAFRAGGGIAPASSLRDDGRFTLATRAELDAHAIEAAVFNEAELVRYTRWANELEARVLRLE